MPQHLQKPPARDQRSIFASHLFNAGHVGKLIAAPAQPDGRTESLPLLLQRLTAFPPSIIRPTEFPAGETHPGGDGGPISAPLGVSRPCAAPRGRESPSPVGAAIKLTASSGELDQRPGRRNLSLLCGITGPLLSCGPCERARLHKAAVEAAATCGFRRIPLALSLPSSPAGCCRCGLSSWHPERYMSLWAGKPQCGNQEQIGRPADAGWAAARALNWENK